MAKPFHLPVRQSHVIALRKLIRRLITDRFAPATEGAPCNTADRVYCGGTWKTIVDKLDYVQGMGYDAIWISPTAQNIEGFTQYGEAFHVSAFVEFSITSSSA